MNLFLHDLSLSRRSKAINAVVGGVAIWVCVLIYAFSASPLELELELDLKLDKHSQSQSHSYSYLAKVDAGNESTSKRKHQWNLRKVNLMPHQLYGAVFSGHYPTPDLDSVASAVGGAYLFQGLAAIPGAINAESKFVLDRYDLPYPGQLDSVYKHGSAYVLVDHNDRFQVPPLLRGNPDDIRGIIDHHTLAQIPAKASKPTYVQIRPWGSCSTIIATLYSDFDIPIPPSIAGLLLGGIISDTLGLKGPTTTGVDRSVAISLAAIVTGSGANEHFKQSHHENKHDHKKWDFDNFIHSLALEQFQAKANQTSKSLYAIATSDFKVYEISHIDDKGNRKMFKVGWGTVETVEPFYSQYLRKATISELDLAVLPRIMKEQKLDLIYLSIVDILEQTSVFLACCTEEDVQVLEEAFPGQKILRTFKGPDGDTDGVELQGKGVSRKKEFIPPLKNSLLRSPPP